LISANESATNSSFYIYSNTLSVSVNQFQEAIDDLRTCESSRISTLTKIVYYLMLAGLVTVGLSFLIVLWYLIKVDKQINLCWNRFSQTVEDNYSLLKGIAIDRLAQYHKIYNQDDEKISHRPKKTKLKFNFYWNYMIKFSILFILSVFLYLVAVLVFYNNIQSYLNYRLKFILTIGDTRVKLIQLAYFTIEEESTYRLYPKVNLFNYTLSPDLRVSFNRTNEALVKLRREIKSPSVYQYIPNQVWTMLYSQVDQYNGFLKYGALAGIDYYRYESMCILSPSCRNKNLNLTTYFNSLSGLIAVLTNVTSTADIDSKIQIEKELNSLIYFTVFILVFFIIFYTVYYLPYLTKQQDTVKKIEFVIKTVPETSNINSFDDVKSKTISIK
jgi:heme/copper-type cytochrome/quinol oxidase subunit 4